MLWDAPFVDGSASDPSDGLERPCEAKRYEPAREKIHALLIEIDALAREALNAIARRSKQLDIDVTACRSLEEAETALKQVHFDVVYLDYWLGSETSVPFIHALDSRSGPPCVVLTDLDEPDIRRIAFRAGAQAFLSKESLNPQALEGVTLAVLRKWMKAVAAA
jgi:DNA-binding NarL/FixJ family response regulator